MQNVHIYLDLIWLDLSDWRDGAAQFKKFLRWAGYFKSRFRLW